MKNCKKRIYRFVLMQVRQVRRLLNIFFVGRNRSIIKKEKYPYEGIIIHPDGKFTDCSKISRDLIDFINS